MPDINEYDEYVIPKPKKRKRFTKEEQKEKHREYVKSWRRRQKYGNDGSTVGASVD